MTRDEACIQFAPKEICICGETIHNYVTTELSDSGEIDCGASEGVKPGKQRRWGSYLVVLNAYLAATTGLGKDHRVVRPPKDSNRVQPC